MCVLITFSFFFVSLETLDGARRVVIEAETKEIIAGSTDQAEPELGFGKRKPKKRKMKDFVTDGPPDSETTDSESWTASSSEEEQPVARSDLPSDLGNILNFIVIFNNFGINLNVVKSSL